LSDIKESLIQDLTARKGFFNLKAELTTGGGDVVALLAAERRLGAGVAEDSEEFVLPRFVGAFPIESLDRVVGNEVDPGIHATGLFGEETRLLEQPRAHLLGLEPLVAQLQLDVKAASLTK
jgi:hypothetical protein